MVSHLIFFRYSPFNNDFLLTFAFMPKVADGERYFILPIGFKFVEPSLSAEAVQFHYLNINPAALIEYKMILPESLYIQH